MADKTDLQKIKEWIATFPDYKDLAGFEVDYTDQVPANGGLFPSGTAEIRRTRDILGNVTVEKQLNFAIYFVFTKAPGDDAGATVNQEWIASFQSWTEAQSVNGLAPTFGDDGRREKITASNGMLYDASEEGVGIYAVTLTITFVKRY